MDINVGAFEECLRSIQNIDHQMSQDKPLIVQVKLNFDLSYDIHKLLTLFFLLPLLEFINAFIKFPKEGIFSF